MNDQNPTAGSHTEEVVGAGAICSSPTLVPTDTTTTDPIVTDPIVNETPPQQPLPRTTSRPDTPEDEETNTPIEDAPPQPPEIDTHIIECHSFYSVLMFIVSSIQPILYLHAYFTQLGSDEESSQTYGLKKFEEFWGWTQL
ncbi:hypothetical protein TrST_g14081 [Triparma strigata]|uniref:Uncharacterized protein n=1 Tax=Triparma strigata TaxID=1606541 RepID=A0A9W7DWM7_9STRA|nr:hypothetical protein TrST_g14081 [Triparma strigata]